MYLSEGLKEGDLAELVMPLVSIDEFESKLDDDSMVIAFHAMDRDPASDLNRFIQKGPVDILDTDVSPAPDEDGYYMVFVEILRDAEAPKKILSILDSLSGLTGLTEWKAQVYDLEGQYPVDDKFLNKHLRLDSKMDDQEHDHTMEEEIKEFFQATDLDDMIVENGTVVLEARGVTWTLEYVDHGNIDEVYENNAVMYQATRLDESALSNARRMSNMLGDFWIAEQRGDHIVIGHVVNNECMLLRL